MALKKGILDSYIEVREKPNVKFSRGATSQYSHNRVFDEPESLKNILDLSLTNVQVEISDDSLSSDLNRCQTVSSQVNIYKGVEQESNSTLGAKFTSSSQNDESTAIKSKIFF